ncbi:MAG: leucine-rich repeat protein, partial [Clostridia bacterium]|nr:leucine-rich repeat protein [Clostridia bacterium]
SLCIVSCDSAKTTEPIPNSPSGVTEQSSPEQAEKDTSVLSPSTEKSERPAEEPSLSPASSEEPSPTKEEPTPSASKEEPTPSFSDEEPTPTPSPEECTHTFGDWQTVTQATCQKEGQQERTCTLCGEKEEEPTKKAAHTEVTLPAVAASCSKTGLTAGTQCSVCNTVLQKQEIITVKDHTAITDKAVAATCTKTGLSEGSHCSVCDKVLKKQETVPVKDHTAVTDKAVAATCTKTGLSEGSHCSVCDKVLKKQETVAATGHDHKKSTVAATCSKAGYDLFTCHCGNSYKENEKPATNAHKFIAKRGTYQDLSYDGYFCSSCNLEVCSHGQANYRTDCTIYYYISGPALYDYDEQPFKRTLYVYGKGAIPDFDGYNTARWHCEYAPQVTEIVILDGITAVGERAFSTSDKSFQNVKKVTMSDSVTSVGQYAFKDLSPATFKLGSGVVSFYSNCITLTSSFTKHQRIYIPKSVKHICDTRLLDAYPWSLYLVYEGTEEEFLSIKIGSSGTMKDLLERNAAGGVPENRISYNAW